MLVELAALGAEADREEVERLFKERAREWKVRTVLFKGEADAKGFVKAAAAGEKFDVLAKKAIDDKRATGSEDGEYLPREQMPRARHKPGQDADSER
mgnify:CR=1 FL=1